LFSGDVPPNGARRPSNAHMVSPDPGKHLDGAIIDSTTAFSEISKQALIPKNKSAINDALFGPAGLYEALVEAYMAGKMFRMAWQMWSYYYFPTLPLLFLRYRCKKSDG
jgi:hypothetical protein